MRKYYAFLFISIYLFSTTQFSELLKVQVLIEHFQEHQQWDKAMSFSSFLYMHYVEDDVPAPDHDRDMQMPFKMIHSNAMTFVSFIVETPQLFINSIVHFEKQKQILPSDDFGYASLYLSAIWQPPQIC